MSTTIDVKHWWPDFIATMNEFEQIRKGYNKELSLAWADDATLNSNMYLNSMDADTCAVWEAMLGITPASDATVEARRREIILLAATSRPYTKKRLREILNAYLGVGGYRLTINTAAKTVSIDIATAGRASYIYERIRKIIPADMILLVGDAYNRHEALTALTHSGMSAYTHEQVRTDLDIV